MYTDSKFAYNKKWFPTYIFLIIGKNLTIQFLVALLNMTKSLTGTPF